MARGRWLIRGYDGVVPTFERGISGSLSESEVTALLQRLVARHLTEDEIVDASLRRNFAGYAAHLEPRRSTTGKFAVTIEVGDHVNYIAAFEDFSDT